MPYRAWLRGVDGNVEVPLSMALERNLLIILVIQAACRNKLDRYIDRQ